MRAKLHKTARSKIKPAVAPRSKKKATNKGLAGLIESTSSQPLSIAHVRKEFGINRKLFARLTGYSERAVAQWEGGTKPSAASLQRIVEMRRLHAALATVIRPDFVPTWLQLPSDAFGGLKPIEVVERGEIDRLWHMIFVLESGMPG